MATTINGTTGASQIQDDTATTAKILDSNVTNAKMADDAIGVAELSATGTASSSTFLRGDNAWATPSSGGMTVLGTVAGSGTTLTFSSINCSLYKFLVFSITGLTAASIANPIFKLGSLNATTGDWIPGDAQTSNTFEGMIWLDTSNNTGIITIAYNIPALSAGDTAYGGASIHRMQYSKGSDIQAQTSADIVWTLAGGVAWTGGSITLYGVN